VCCGLADHPRMFQSQAETKFKRAGGTPALRKCGVGFNGLRSLAGCVVVDAQKRRPEASGTKSKSWRVANFFGGRRFTEGRAGTARRAPTGEPRPCQDKCVARSLLMDDNAGWPGGSVT
jgi:hypothetical protein